MLRATLQIRSNDTLTNLSDSHPESEFTILGAWPREDDLRVLIEASPTTLLSLETTISNLPTITGLEIRYVSDESVLFEANTPTPPAHGAMDESGIVPTFPLSLKNGWITGDIHANQKQFGAFRDELEEAGIEYRLIRLSGEGTNQGGLTERQQEVVSLALQQGYYDVPRTCSLTELAELLDVNKSVVSRILQRAESRIITEYCGIYDS